MDPLIVVRIHAGKRGQKGSTTMKLRGQMMLHGTASQRANYVWKRGIWFEARREQLSHIKLEIRAIEAMIPQAEAAQDWQAVDAMKARIMELGQVVFENA